jgi:hypothetical protein
MSGITVAGTAQTGPIRTFVTNGRGLTPEEVAELALRKLIGIADTAAPAVRDQARMFKDQLRPVLIHYMKQAIASDRTTLSNKLTELGYKDLAANIQHL